MKWYWWVGIGVAVLLAAVVTWGAYEWWQEFQRQLSMG